MRGRGSRDVNEILTAGMSLGVHRVCLPAGFAVRWVFTQVPMHVRSGVRCTWTGCVESQQSTVEGTR